MIHQTNPRVLQPPPIPAGAKDDFWFDNLPSRPAPEAGLPLSLKINTIFIFTICLVGAIYLGAAEQWKGAFGTLLLLSSGLIFFKRTWGRRIVQVIGTIFASISFILLLINFVTRGILPPTSGNHLGHDEVFVFLLLALIVLIYEVALLSTHKIAKYFS